MSEQQNEAREAAIDTAQRRWVSQHSSPDGLQIHAGAIMCWREGYESATADHAAEVERLRAALGNLVEAVDQSSKDAIGIYQIAAIHGMPYTGRKYGDELIAAQAALATPEGEE